ncbi:hypothetical protein E2562_024137 [Oryza meyeriana var. granulata]|uniref:DUF834 domain-containing protein n=1 Tax=Oryza meyeriana var. granulata TaxID=110450 RepID=A0A6G1EP86_9ORYZ|nr:hypothetical protein E2562_024137 [Oryza meyeriana var. granulata]
MRGAGRATAAGAGLAGDEEALACAGDAPAGEADAPGDRDDPGVGTGPGVGSGPGGSSGPAGVVSGSGVVSGEVGEAGPHVADAVVPEAGPRVAKSVTPRETGAHTADAGAPRWVGGSMSSIRKSNAEGDADIIQSSNKASLIPGVLGRRIRASH